MGTITSLAGYTKTANDAGAAIAFATGTVPCLLAIACIDGFSVTNTREFSEELNFASRQFGIASFVAGLYYYDANVDTTGGLGKTLFPVSAYETELRY